MFLGVAFFNLLKSIIMYEMDEDAFNKYKFEDGVSLDFGNQNKKPKKPRINWTAIVITIIIIITILVLILK